jgi:hypothetical protein
MSTKPLAKQVVPGSEGAESASAEDGAIRPRDSLFHWCGLVDALRQTNDPADRQALLEAYFAAVAAETVAPAARFFLGTIGSRNGETGPAVADETVIRAMQDLARMHPDELRERCRTAEDLGCVAAELFAGRLPSGLSMSEVASWGKQLRAARDEESRHTLVRDMLARLNSLEARYLVNLITGRLALGLDEATIEEVLAQTFGQPLSEVRAAKHGGRDIGEVAQLAKQRAIA